MITRHISVVGRVQGVGFRRWAEKNATKQNLSGWVRNVSDGSVEIVIKGHEEDINHFLSLCWQGPIFSNVIMVQPVTIPKNTPLPIEEGVFKIVASV